MWSVNWPGGEIAEEYDEEELAVSHVRRVLDIVACTTSFGAWGSSKNNSPKSDENAIANNKSKSDDEEETTRNSCPKLGTFYHFFSLSHLTPPLQCTLFYYTTALLTMFLSFFLYYYSYFLVWVSLNFLRLNYTSSHL